MGIASSLAKPRRPSTKLRYIGAHKIAGPAPRGVPYIPIEVQDGILHGRTTLDVGGETWATLSWLRFCGHEDAPGLDGGYSGDNVLRYHLPEGVTTYIRPWYADRVDEPVRVDDFPGPGFAARFRWRSEAADESTWLWLTGIVLKLDTPLAEPESLVAPAKPLTRDERRALERLGASGFVAASNLCTHFCCESGYNEAEQLARPRNAWDKMFCTCHNATFDMRAPVAYEVDDAGDIGPGLS